MKSVIHGETIVNKINKLPKGIKKVELKGKYQIIANSEVTGNHHVVDLVEGVEFYEKEGTLYFKNEKETQVRCLIKERHDAITLEPGVWEVGFQQEYDYLKDEKRNVAD